ncbi:unnamed protein product [Sphagnum jensenii]
MIILQTAGELHRAYMGQDDTHEVDAAYPAVADHIWTPILQLLMDLGQLTKAGNVFSVNCQKRSVLWKGGVEG